MTETDIDCMETHEVTKDSTSDVHVSSNKAKDLTLALGSKLDSSMEHNSEEEGAVDKVPDEDLEEGECSDDDDGAVAESAPKVELPPAEKSRKDKRESGEKRHKHRDRDRSRERHRSKKHKRRRDEKEEAENEEMKKKHLLRKLKALEGEMGIEREAEYYEDELSGVYAEGGSPRSEDENSSRSRSGSRSPGQKDMDRRRKRERPERDYDRKRRKIERRERIEPKSDICGLFMQGKCSRPASECLYSHDAEPPQVWELCKFYLFDRCAKREKCLYLHKGFPCKYHHTGQRCLDTDESCKFSHEPLNDTTRALLLKHIESAPKEILGDFPRMSREAAASTIFNTEAKHKGWIVEGPNAVQPPSFALPQHVASQVDHQFMDKKRQHHGHFGPGPHHHGPHHGHHGPLGHHGLGGGGPGHQGHHGPPRFQGHHHHQGGHGGMADPPTHLKLDPLQEKLFQGANEEEDGGEQWQEGDERYQGKGPFPPLAVQQAMAMTSSNPPGPAGFGTRPQGPVGHGVRNNGAFSQGPVRPHRSPNMSATAPSRPADLMQVKVNEEEVQNFLKEQRKTGTEDPTTKEVTTEDQSYETDSWANSQEGGDETPEVTPPVSPRAGTPTPGECMDFDDQPDSSHDKQPAESQQPPKLPKAQQRLFDRIQQKQKERKVSQDSTVDETVEPQPEDDTNWYSDDEDDSKVLDNVLKKLDTPELSPKLEESAAQPVALGKIGLPAELSNVLSAISSTNGAKAEASAVPQPAVEKPQRKRIDPRLAKRDTLQDEQAQREAEEKEKEKRLLSLDLKTMFGDLELPPLTTSPKQSTDYDADVSNTFGLPFKPHIIGTVAKEIEAGFNKHGPMDYELRPILVSKPDYSGLRHHLSQTQLDTDPRLRRFAKTSMAKMKELPLPEFPGGGGGAAKPSLDPRLKSRLDPRSARRRSSEESDGGQVYNPHKDLMKRNHPQQLANAPGDMPYSPSQEYYSPGEEEVYNPAKDLTRPPHGSHGQQRREGGWQQQRQFNYRPPPRGDQSGYGPPPPPHGHYDGYPPYHGGGGPPPYEGEGQDFYPEQQEWGNRGPPQQQRPPPMPQRTLLSSASRARDPRRRD